MTVKQKAKAYDKAIEKLHNFYKDYDTVSNLIDVKEELVKIFPELKESEDEQIRKRLINLVNEIYDNTNYITFLEHKELLAWLEKLDDNAEL